MARRRQRDRGTRREEAIVKLMAVGGAFVLVPLFAGNTLVGKMLGPLMPIGLLLLVGGGVFLWLVRRGSTPTLPKISPAASRVTRPSERALHRAEPQGLEQAWNDLSAPVTSPDASARPSN